MYKQESFRRILTHGRLERITSALEEAIRECKISHKDAHKGNHNSRRGRLPHALGAAEGRDTPRAAHHGDDPPKDIGLDHRAYQIPRPQRFPRGIEYDVYADAVDGVRQEGAGSEADGEAHESENRKSGAAGDDARSDEVVNGIGAEDAESISLLRDLHGAELSSEGGSDATSSNDGGDNGAELTGEGKGQDAANRAVKTETSELANELDGEGHADEGGGEEGNTEGARASALELLECVAPMDLVGDDGAVEDLAGEDGDGEGTP